MRGVEIEGSQYIVRLHEKQVHRDCFSSEDPGNLPLMLREVVPIKGCGNEAVMAKAQELRTTLTKAGLL
jgi:hypothetical protein